MQDFLIAGISFPISKVANLLPKDAQVEVKNSNQWKNSVTPWVQLPISKKSKNIVLIQNSVLINA